MAVDKSLVSGSTMMLILKLQEIIDVIIQMIQIILHERHIDFLVYLQNLFEKLQVQVFHFQEITAFSQHTVFNKKTNTLFLVFS